MTRIVCISDTHSILNEVKLPAGDILIHAGDFTNIGELQDVVSFIKDLKPYKSIYKQIIVIAGNHDFCFENTQRDVAEQLLKDAGIIYLRDTGITINGINFWGSPWQPTYGNWAFNLQRGKEINKKWKLIPKNTDVLITHGPPYGILDIVEGQHVGCVDLAKHVQTRIKPKFHIFGHLHEGYGIHTQNKTTYVNASIRIKWYNPSNDPIVIEL